METSIEEQTSSRAEGRRIPKHFELLLHLKRPASDQNTDTTSTHDTLFVFKVCRNFQSFNCTPHSITQLDKCILPLASIGYSEHILRVFLKLLW